MSKICQKARFQTWTEKVNKRLTLKNTVAKALPSKNEVKKSALLFKRTFPWFGGPENFDNRLAVGDERKRLLYAAVRRIPIAEVPALLPPPSDCLSPEELVEYRVIQGFFESYLYSSSEALRKQFPTQFKPLIEALGLVEGTGWEVPEQNVAAECQLFLLKLPLTRLEQKWFQHLRNIPKMAYNLDVRSIYVPESFEQNDRNSTSFLFKTQFLEYLTRINPNLDVDAYKALVRKATAMRNAWAHKDLCSTSYLLEVNDIVLQLFDMLRENQSSEDCWTIRFWQRCISGWDSWDVFNQEKEREEMYEIKSEAQDMVERGLLTSEKASRKIRSWGRKILERRKEDKKNLGRSLMAYLSGEGRMPFEYPTSRIPVRDPLTSLIEESDEEEVKVVSKIHIKVAAASNKRKRDNSPAEEVYDENPEADEERPAKRRAVGSSGVIQKVKNRISSAGTAVASRFSWAPFLKKKEDPESSDNPPVIN